jgi:hypothetical protein
MLEWSYLIRLWMHLERNTHRNGTEIRKAVVWRLTRNILLDMATGGEHETPETSSFFVAYQRVAKNTIIKRSEHVLRYGPYICLILLGLPFFIGMYPGKVRKRNAK